MILKGKVRGGRCQQLIIRKNNDSKAEEYDRKSREKDEDILNLSIRL